MGLVILLLSLTAACVIILIVYISRTIAVEQMARKLSRIQTEPRIATKLMDEKVMDIAIAGVLHHCTTADIGPFIGIVYNDAKNPCDKNAMAIEDIRKKRLLGYVPAKSLTPYRAWCNGETRHCIGFIFWDGEHLRGRCRIYPSIERTPEVVEDSYKYMDIVTRHFGWEFNDDGNNTGEPEGPLQGGAP